MIVSFAGAFRGHNDDFSPGNAVFSEGKQLVSDRFSVAEKRSDTNIDT
jgi:hypothetical protein